MQKHPGDAQKVLLPSPATKVVTRPASVPNFSRVLKARNNSIPGRQHRRSHTLDQYSALSPRKTANTKRWDPQSRTSSPWDGLRHDDELWSQDGDYYIHLYGKGRSKRGPSFRISRSSITAVGWDVATPLQPGLLECPPSSSCLSSDSIELFFSAPEHALREDAFRWHLTTRNFFAWMTKKPLVGLSLGDALIDLLVRMRHFRPCADNTGDLISYLDSQGYMDFAHNPDYALAILRFAEHHQIQSVWIEAFSHCVGMNDLLYSSLELNSISRVTKALISRAHLEMDLHIGRVSKAMRTFLEDELSPTNFGLSEGAQAHLERFRSFLHSFYVNQFGYWPPEEGSYMSKSLLRRMHTDFTALYDFLVDRTPNAMLGQGKPANGGICVLQNLSAFDQRHNYEPLLHPLPLVPDCHGSAGRTQSQRGLRALKLGTKQLSELKFEEGMSMRSALAMSTNSGETDVLEYPLIKAYVRFEQEWSVKPREKVSVADARKVRWIAIYTILQMLTSVTHAPKEVRNAETVSYHMCLLTAGTPPWPTKVPDAMESGTTSIPATSFELDTTEATLTIQPDCEFMAYLPKRSDSAASLRPAPLRISNGSSLARTSSFKSIRKQIASIKSSASLRRSSLASSSSLSPLRDYGVSTYDIGNGLSSTSMQRREFDMSITEDSESQVLSPLQPSVESDLLRHEAATPVLDLAMLSIPGSEYDSSSTSSEHCPSPSSTVSTPISALEDLWHSSSDDADTSSWTSGDDRRNSRGIYSMEHESVTSRTSHSYQPSWPSTPSPGPRSMSGFFSLLPLKTSPQQKAVEADATAGGEGASFRAPYIKEHEELLGEEMPDLDAEFDMHRALEFLPHRIAAQAL